MTLGEKILFNRKQLGLSQEELANKLYVTRQSISLWETNQSLPSTENLLRLCEIFNVSMDELCNLKEEQSYIIKCSTNYNYDIYKTALLYQYKKTFKTAIILMLLLVYIILAISFSEAKTYLFIPILFLLFFGVSIVIICNKILKAARLEDKNKSNAKSDFYFYGDYFEIHSSTDLSSSNYKKKYKEIADKVIINGYLYIFLTNALYTAIRLTDDNKEFLLDKFDIKEKKKNSKDKIILNLFVILSVLSIFIGLLIAGISTSLSLIPEFQFSFVEHLWKLYLVIPLPLTSLVLGAIYYKKYQCKVNIIVGIIMCALLTLYGSFTHIFKEKISHDYEYIKKIEVTIRSELPNGYVSTYYEKELNKTTTMLRINQDEINGFVSYIDSNWQTTSSFLPINALDVYDSSIVIDYDYFFLYDVNCGKYLSFHEVGHDYVFMAYNIKSNLLYIIEFNK